MDELISKQVAIDAMKKQRKELLKGLDKNSNVYGIISASMGIVICTVGQLPSAQPEPKRGRWTGDNACSECGYQPWFSGDIHNYSFCPNCGARMEVEQDG